jgi:maltooligosyltrehalose trehalohydrolase
MHEFTVWAPKAKKVSVKVGDALHPMAGPDERGWWKARWRRRGRAPTMGFCWTTIRRSIPIRAARQPNGVHGPRGCTTRRRFAWHDGAGRRLRWRAR